MYELTCPACHHVMSRSFARVGARIPCDKCGRKFEITAGNTKRVSRSASLVGAFKIGTIGDAAADPAGSATHNEPTPIRPATLPVGEIIPGPAAPARRVDARRVARIRSLYRLGLVAVAGLMLLIVVLFIAQRALTIAPLQSNSSGAVSTREQPNSKPLAVRRLADLDPRVTLRKAEPLEPSDWWSVDEPWADPPSVSVTLANPKIDSSDAERPAIFTADVRSERPQMISSLAVHLVLLDRSGRVFARTEIPLVLLTGTAPQPLRVPIPRHLYKRLGRVQWSFELGPEFPGAVFFEKSTIRASGSGRNMLAQVTAFNPVNQPLKNVLFVITARDSTGVALRKWQVDWGKVIDPQQRVDFAALTPVDKRWEIAAWDIIGAGIPQLADMPDQSESTTED